MAINNVRLANHYSDILRTTIKKFNYWYPISKTEAKEFAELALHYNNNLYDPEGYSVCCAFHCQLDGIGNHDSTCDFYHPITAIINS